ncbi:MAG: HEAT repeat domain-containing protein [Promethearchaeia archaeon]
MILKKILEEIDKIGKFQTTEKLHNLFSESNDRKLRREILEALNKLKDDKHFEKFEYYFLSDEDIEVRIEAAKILTFYYPKKKVIRPLIWVFENEENNLIKFTALRLLTVLGFNNEYTEIIKKKLLKSLKSNDMKLVQEAAEALGILREKTAVNDLIEALKILNHQVRIKIIQALGEIKVERAVPYLLELLASARLDIWRFSFEALKKILGNKVNEYIYEKLISVQSDPKNVDKGFLRKGAIKALGELKDKNAVKIIIKALGDYFYWVRWEAADALDKIEPNWREKYKYLLYKYNIPKNIKK